MSKKTKLKAKKERRKYRRDAKPTRLQRKKARKKSENEFGDYSRPGQVIFKRD